MAGWTDTWWMVQKKVSGKQTHTQTDTHTHTQTDGLQVVGLRRVFAHQLVRGLRFRPGPLNKPKPETLNLNPKPQTLVFSVRSQVRDFGFGNQDCGCLAFISSFGAFGVFTPRVQVPNNHILSKILTYRTTILKPST